MILAAALFVGALRGADATPPVRLAFIGQCASRAAMLDSESEIAFSVDERGQIDTVSTSDPDGFMRVYAIVGDLTCLTWEGKL